MKTTIQVLISSKSKCAHQEEFKESFYNPNKQMLESNFAVSTSVVHDRGFILYKNMRGESCKHIG